MKKLSLKNLKVMKMTKEEKRAITGGYDWQTTSHCNNGSGPYVSWCHGCTIPYTG